MGSHRRARDRVGWLAKTLVPFACGCRTGERPVAAPLVLEARAQIGRALLQLLMQKGRGCFSERAAAEGQGPGVAENGLPHA